MRTALTAAALAAGLFGSSPIPASAAEPQHCVTVDVVLWGDGRHDDTAGLNAWLAGRDAVWAEDGAAVGPRIAGRSFRLSSAIYVEGGTGRSLEDFELRWPERNETVSGGSIHAGKDPDQAPILSGIRIVGGDAGEGVPFETPTGAAPMPDSAASCATS